jgi:hypothetical protein
MRTPVRIAFAVVAILVVAGIPASAQGKKPKLYTVSLSGSTSTQVTETREGDFPPSCCAGSSTETNKFSGSAKISPKPSAAPVASYGRLRFNVKLKSLSAAASHDVTGSWAVDPNAFEPADPATCTFKPQHSTGTCKFTREATRRSGAPFALLPHGKVYELYFNSNAGIVSCNPDPLGGRIFGEFVDTKLKVSSVKGLGVGRSASASGSVTTPAKGGSGTTGGETDKYRLTVKRVR